MGNAGSRCADAAFRCTEHCTRISCHDAVVAETAYGGCDPAGAVFEETLQELSDLDRQLILFASSSNVIAVRWLLEMNASMEAHDTNGTTCLHAACRSGSQLVVMSLLETRRKVGRPASTLNASDASGWTPLHISVFMGRPEVCVHLLEKRAQADKRNLLGQIPLELCNDARTRAVLLGSGRTVTQRRNDDIEGSMAEGYLVQGTRRNSMEGFDQTIQNSSGPHSRAGQEPSPLPEERCEVHFEPFFVPRPPVVRGPSTTEESKAELKQLGRAIFKRQPGRGLAFLVASGCTRDYPIELVALLRGHGFDLSMIGTFLGEDFSLSKILRMEFMNSINLVHAGIVQSLNKAFAHFSAPYDFRKVDRILACLAEVWWRQHLREPPSLRVEPQPLPYRLAPQASKPIVLQQPSQDAVERPTPEKDNGSDEAWVAESPNQSMHSADDGDGSTLEQNIEGGQHEQSSSSLVRQLPDEIGQIRGPPPTPEVPHAMPSFRSMPETQPVRQDRELGGFELRRCLSGPGLLHQMMFSALMLYWNQHDSQRDAPVNLERWLELNDCFDLSTSTAEYILTPIYTLICRAPLPNPPVTKSIGQTDQEVGTSAMQDLAQVEGWVRILGDAMPLIGTSARKGGTATDVWQLFSEATASSRRTHPDNLLGRNVRTGLGSSSPISSGSSRVIPRSSLSVRRQDAPSAHATSTLGLNALWLSLCNYFLFFSLAEEDGSPFAFIPVAKAHFASIEPAHSTFALDGGPDFASQSAPPDASSDIRGAAQVHNPLPTDLNGQAKPRTSDSAARLPLVLIFLLPDGRWQSFEVPQLVIQVCDKAQLEAWVLRLSDLVTMGPEDVVP